VDEDGKCCVIKQVVFGGFKAGQSLARYFRCNLKWHSILTDHWSLL